MDMYLRDLKLKDAELMLEWMHDDNVIENMQTDFASKQLEDCERFINTASLSTEDKHFAIVDGNDNYMGTVSLKHIESQTAEFAITVRSAAMGKGYSRYGMQEIIKYGLNEMHLKKIYWCVSPDNKRAVKFYDKNGYARIDIKEICQCYSVVKKNYSISNIDKYIWYMVEED